MMKGSMIFSQGCRRASNDCRAPSLAKFGEVDTVPVSENSLKYNTFCQ